MPSPFVLLRRARKSHCRGARAESGNCGAGGVQPAGLGAALGFHIDTSTFPLLAPRSQLLTELGTVRPTPILWGTDQSSSSANGPLSRAGDRQTLGTRCKEQAGACSQWSSGWSPRGTQPPAKGDAELAAGGEQGEGSPCAPCWVRAGAPRPSTDRQQDGWQRLCTQVRPPHMATS